MWVKLGPNGYKEVKGQPRGKLGLKPTGVDMVRARLSKIEFRVRLQWLRLEIGLELGL